MSEESSNVSYVFITIIIILSVLLATGTSYFMFVKLGGGGGNGEDSAAQAQKEELGPTTKLGDFVVNLAEGESFVKVNIVFEVSNEKVMEEINQRSPQMRDTIISILRKQNQEGVNSVEGTRKLRTDIMERVNDNLMKGKVTNVFFTEFVLQ